MARLALSIKKKLTKRTQQSPIYLTKYVILRTLFLLS